MFMTKRLTALAAWCVLVSVALTGCLRAPSPDAVPDVRRPMALYLDMAQEDIDLLYSRDVFSSERLPGAFRLDPGAQRRPLADPSIRFRGSSSRVLPKKSFSVRFAEPEPFVFGTESLNLIAMWTDPSLMRAVLAFDMFRQVDVLASRTRYVDLYMNDVYEGLYVAVQRVDGDLLASYGRSLEGSTLVRDAFRDTRPGGVASMFSYDWSLEPDPVELLRSSVDSRGEPDIDALWELVQWVHETPPGPSYAAGFESRVDLTSFIDWLAIHVLIADIDSFADDYWLFLDGSEPGATWRFIPWDKDLSFGSHSVSGFGVANDFFHLEFTPYTGWNNALVRKFLDTDDLYAQFIVRVDALMDDVFTVDRMRGEIHDLAAGIGTSVNRTQGPGAFVRHPANHHGALGYFDQHTEALISFVERRYAFLKRSLRPRPPEAIRYESATTLTEDAVGSSVLLTDDYGWTIARVEVHSLTGDDPVLRVRVENDERVSTIDRLWTFEVEGGQLTGAITLYYRNNRREGNWYRPGDPSIEPIGGQRDLRVASVHAVSASSDTIDVEVIQSNANPYANAVTTIGSVDVDGAATFALVDRLSLR